MNDWPETPDTPLAGKPLADWENTKPTGEAYRYYERLDRKLEGLQLYSVQRLDAHGQILLVIARALIRIGRVLERAL